ncbi:MAG: lytic transglycosylase domain-containing protein [Devosia sp.]|nr:lytic transglycosylase domain-containing protein [Devosia sp.]
MSRAWALPVVTSIAVIIAPLSGSVLAAPETVSPISPVPLTAPMAGRSLDSFIAEASQRFGIPTAWISAVIRQESRRDPRAVSSAGAMGLMQIRPATWTELRNRYHLGSDPFDTHDNIIAGTAYLSELLRQFGSPAFLAAYNMGPARYASYVEGGLALPAETQHYLAELAPVVADGHILAGGEIASPAAVPWTGSPLFVALSSNIGPAQKSPPNDDPAIAQNAVIYHASAQVDPAVASLFAASPAGDLFP